MVAFGLRCVMAALTGCITGSAVGCCLIGAMIFGLPYFFLGLVGFSVGLLYAAPLNLLALPLTSSLLRRVKHRQLGLYAVGIAGGPLSLMVIEFGSAFWRSLHVPSSEMVITTSVASIGPLAAVGAVAGLASAFAFSCWMKKL